MTLHSGLIERSTQARITFPATRQTVSWLYLLAGLVLLLGVTGVLVGFRPRRLPQAAR